MHSIAQQLSVLKKAVNKLIKYLDKNRLKKKFDDFKKKQRSFEKPRKYFKFINVSFEFEQKTLISRVQKFQRNVSQMSEIF